MEQDEKNELLKKLNTMNNKFDWNRFCKVVKKDFCNLWPTFGTTMIVLASLPFAVWLLALVIDRTTTPPLS